MSLFRRVTNEIELCINCFLFFEEGHFVSPISITMFCFHYNRMATTGFIVILEIQHFYNFACVIGGKLVLSNQSLSPNV